MTCNKQLPYQHRHRARTTEAMQTNLWSVLPLSLLVEPTPARGQTAVQESRRACRWARALALGQRSEPVQPNLQEAAALLLLKLKECHKLTQSALQVNSKILCVYITATYSIYPYLQAVIEGTTMLWQGHLTSLHSKVCQAVEAVGVDPRSVPDLDGIFDPENEFSHPFAGLQTQYRQIKYYRQKFGLVVSYLRVVESNCHAINPLDY